MKGDYLEYYDKARKECMASLASIRSRAPAKPRRKALQTLNANEQAGKQSVRRRGKSKSPIPGSQFDLADF